MGKKIGKNFTAIIICISILSMCGVAVYSDIRQVKIAEEHSARIEAMTQDNLNKSLQAQVVYYQTLLNSMR